MKSNKQNKIDVMLNTALENVSSNILEEIYVSSLGIYQDPSQLHLNCGICPKREQNFASLDFPFPIDLKEFGFLTSPIFSCFTEYQIRNNEVVEEPTTSSPVSITSKLDCPKFDYKEVEIKKEAEPSKLLDLNELLCSTCHKRIPEGKKLDNTPYKTCSLCIARKKKHYRKIKYMSKFDF